MNVNSTTVISLHEKKSKTGYDFLITHTIIKQLNITKSASFLFFILGVEYYFKVRKSQSKGPLVYLN